MPMSSKELHALVSRESEKKDERRRPALRFYDATNRHTDKADLPVVEMTADDVEAEAGLKAFAREQEALEAEHGSPDEDGFDEQE